MFRPAPDTLSSVDLMKSMIALTFPGRESDAAKALELVDFQVFASEYAKADRDGKRALVGGVLERLDGGGGPAGGDSPGIRF